MLFFYTDYAFWKCSIFYRLCSKLCPIYDSKFCKRVYITILIEQELLKTRNDNIEFHKKQEMTQQFYAVLTAVKSH